MQKLLLHICCAPCSGLISRHLSEKYDVTVYFDNSNIATKEEFKKRAEEAEKFFAHEKIKFVLAPWVHDDWLEMAKKFAVEPEKGKRCKLCYHSRLSRAAQYAAQNDFDVFATSLAVSPWKDDLVIHNLGRALAHKYKIEYLDYDFKGLGWWPKILAFAKAEGFYRQKYCGCEFSDKSGIIKLYN